MTATEEALNWLRRQDRPAGQADGISFERDPARALAIMRQRTIQLAAAPVQRGRISASTEFLVFRAAGGRFALGLVALREIVTMPPITGVPGAAEAVCGVMSWRGEFVTVFDLAPSLGLATHDGDAAYAIILRKDAPRIALAIERVERMTWLDTADMRAADAWQTVEAGLLRGATADAVAVLDEKRLVGRLGKELRAA
jgi:chemotaxis signal transduction protein